MVADPRPRASDSPSVASHSSAPTVLNRSASPMVNRLVIRDRLLCGHSAFPTLHATYATHVAHATQPLGVVKGAPQLTGINIQHSVRVPDIPAAVHTCVPDIPTVLAAASRVIQHHIRGGVEDRRMDKQVSWGRWGRCNRERFGAPAADTQVDASVECGM